jgi:DNA-binding NarL/FixJ family response regulator
MARPKATPELSDGEHTELQALARRRKSAQAAALRARIVLACAQGVENNAVAERLHVTKQTVSK